MHKQPGAGPKITGTRTTNSLPLYNPRPPTICLGTVLRASFLRSVPVLRTHSAADERRPGSGGLAALVPWRSRR